MRDLKEDRRGSIAAVSTVFYFSRRTSEWAIGPSRRRVEGPRAGDDPISIEGLGQSRANNGEAEFRPLFCSVRQVFFP